MAHILTIDDDGGIRSFLQQVFEMKGHAVTTAAKGLDALRVFNRSVDLVITDMLMPHMDGLETIRCLKKLAPGLSMIAISGGRVLSRDYLAEAQAMGADRTLAKPFKVLDLQDAVAALLGESPSGAEAYPGRTSLTGARR